MKTRRLFFIMLRPRHIVVFFTFIILLRACVSSPLSDAIWDDRIDKLQTLLEEGADVNARDKFCRTPLIWACASKVGKGETERVETVRVLLKAGADVHTKTLKRGDTALIWAADNGYIEIVELLLEAGADVNVKNKRGNTALTYSKRNRHHKIVELLKKAEAEE